jgi:hypothetical protein
MASRVICLALAVQLLQVNCYDLAEVQFSTAGVQGDEYRRLIEPIVSVSLLECPPPPPIALFRP